MYYQDIQENQYSPEIIEALESIGGICPACGGDEFTEEDGWLLCTTLGNCTWALDTIA